MKTAKRETVPIRVVEDSTFTNLFADGYLLANRDLFDARVDAKTHFERYGYKESRKQFTREFLDSAEYRKIKFERFRPLIKVPRVSKANTFPIRIGQRIYAIEEYQFEPANGTAPEFFAEMSRNPDKNYLDIGCGLPDFIFENCVYLEAYPSRTADVVVEPTCLYPFKNNSFDGIGCFAVLEHTRKPWLVVQEIHRMLKPGGIAIIEWPFLQPLHGFPSHYFNATREGMRELFGEVGFEIQSLATGPYDTPDFAIHWILGDFVHYLPPSLRDEVLNMSIKTLLDHRPRDEFWSRIISAIDDKMISKFASGNTIFAKKPNKR